MNEKDLTPHLVNLLYEQCKTLKFDDEMTKIRIEVAADFVPNNINIVLDIIGIPKENTTGISIEHEDYFCRDSFIDAYYDIPRNEPEGETKKILSELISGYYNYLKED